MPTPDDLYALEASTRAKTRHKKQGAAAKKGRKASRRGKKAGGNTLTELLARITPSGLLAAGSNLLWWLTLPARLVFRFWWWTLFIPAVGASLGLTAFATVAWIYSDRAQRINLDVVKVMPEASLIYDFRGQTLGRFFEEDANRVRMPDGPLPEKLVQAVVATEDQRFFEHPGIDIFGITRAALSNAFRDGGPRQGGSTLTQQLARNSIRRMERTYDRKLLEIFLALRVEREYSKEEILRHYLDRIFFGANIYGAENAARAFFGKSVGELSYGEAALLAGMISGPNSFSPWNDYEKAIESRDRALRRLARHGHITKVQAEKERNEPLALRPRPATGRGYHLAEVRRELLRLLPQKMVDAGGLRVYTTIDYGLQDAAQKILTAHVKDVESWKRWPKRHRGKKLQAAFIAMDPFTGAIRCVVGGRDWQRSQFNRATQAKRQVGSTLKPLVYAASFAERGLSPAAWIEATPFDLTVAGEEPIKAQGAAKYLRINEALARSDNYAAMRAGMEVGPELFIYYAQQAGVKTGIPPYPSSYLGACELTLQEVTGVYATFFAGGTYHHPHIIERVIDSSGNLVYVHEDAPQRVFSWEVARQVVGMLENGVDSGTGIKIRRSYKFEKPAGGKTGTTNDFVDAWFVGGTSSLVAGAWVGLDKPETIMNDGFGSTLALPIWAEVFTAAQDYYTMGPLEVPPTLQPAVIPPGTRKGGGFFSRSYTAQSSFAQNVYLRPDQAWHLKSKPGDNYYTPPLETGPGADEEGGIDGQPEERPVRDFFRQLFER